MKLWKKGFRLFLVIVFLVTLMLLQGCVVYDGYSNGYRLYHHGYNYYGPSYGPRYVYYNPGYSVHIYDGHRRGGPAGRHR
jgi:hypothetical protein